MLNNIGLPGLILLVIVVLVLFGRGKIASLMGEVGKGITAFKRGVKDSTDEADRAIEEARDVTPPNDTPPTDTPPTDTPPTEQRRDATADGSKDSNKV